MTDPEYELIAQVDATLQRGAERVDAAKSALAWAATDAVELQHALQVDLQRYQGLIGEALSRLRAADSSVDSQATVEMYERALTRLANVREELADDVMNWAEGYRAERAPMDKQAEVLEGFRRTDGTDAADSTEGDATGGGDSSSPSP